MARHFYFLLLCFALTGLAHAGQTFENICANPADYDGNAQYGNGNCSTQIGKINVWSNINWTTVTCSDLSESDTYTTLNSVGNVCCGGKPTICTPDYSKICKDPSKYTPDATYTNGPVGGKCGSYVIGPWKNVTSWNSVQCSEFTGDSYNTQTAKGWLNTVFTTNCCSDKQNLCDKDYSKLCKEPSTYQGTKLWATNSNINCNGMMKSQSTGQGPYSAVDWTNPTCISTMTAFSRCCSNEKTICWEKKNYSNYCKNPSDYTPSKVITNGKNCDYYINVVLGNSWSTCADIKLTKTFGNSGSTIGELMSSTITPSCCGTSNRSLCDSSTTTTEAKTSNGFLLRSDTKVFFVAFIIWIGLLH